MIVVDANAVFKLIVKEKYSDIAREVILQHTDLGEPIDAPDVIVPEVLNALWKGYVVRKNLSKKAFDEALGNFSNIVDDLDLIPAGEIKDIAIRIAVSKHITVYDSMYIATSIFRGKPLLSFDEKMLKVASGLGVQLIRYKHRSN